MIIKPVFNWISESGKDTAAALTWGTFIVTCDGDVIWGSAEFEWTWYEMLDWFMENWDALMQPQHNDGSSDYFEFQHDFRHSLQGVLTPRCTVWNDGEEGFIETQNTLISVPVDQWKAFLLECAVSILERMEDSEDERSVWMVREFNRIIKSKTV